MPFRERLERESLSLKGCEHICDVSRRIDNPPKVANCCQPAPGLLRHLTIQPGSREFPIALDGRRTGIEVLRSFFDGQAAEHAGFHDMAESRVLLLQANQGLVEQIEIPRFRLPRHWLAGDDYQALPAPL